MAVDYRKILIAYMKGVVRAEGITFVDMMPHDALSTEERNALFEAENDVRMDRNLIGCWNFGAQR